MNDYILLMHEDATSPVSDDAWGPYFERLSAAGAFAGGSAIGGGEAVRKHLVPAAVTTQLGGYIRVTAQSLDAAKALVVGNPVYEAGGTVEVRHLPKD